MRMLIVIMLLFIFYLKLYILFIYFVIIKLFLFLIIELNLYYINWIYIFLNQNKKSFLKSTYINKFLVFYFLKSVFESNLCRGNQNTSF